MYVYFEFLMPICLYFHMLCWSSAHMCTCSDDHMLSRLLAYMITGFYVHILWNSHTSMFTYFVDQTLLCSHALIIVRSNVNMLLRELVHLPICLNALILTNFFDDHMFRWSPAPTPTSFNDYMPICSLNFTLIPFDVLIIICSNIQMLW